MSFRIRAQKDPISFIWVWGLGLQSIAKQTRKRKTQACGFRLYWFHSGRQRQREREPASHHDRVGFLCLQSTNRKQQENKRRRRRKREIPSYLPCFSLLFYSFLFLLYPPHEGNLPIFLINPRLPFRFSYGPTSLHLPSLSYEPLSPSQPFFLPLRRL